MVGLLIGAGLAFPAGDAGLSLRVEARRLLEEIRGAPAEPAAGDRASWEDRALMLRRAWEALPDGPACAEDDASLHDLERALRGPAPPPTLPAPPDRPHRRARAPKPVSGPTLEPGSGDALFDGSRRRRRAPATDAGPEPAAGPAPETVTPLVRRLRNADGSLAGHDLSLAGLLRKNLPGRLEKARSACAELLRALAVPDPEGVRAGTLAAWLLALLDSKRGLERARDVRLFVDARGRLFLRRTLLKGTRSEPSGTSLAELWAASAPKTAGPAGPHGPRSHPPGRGGRTPGRSPAAKAGAAPRGAGGGAGSSEGGSARARSGRASTPARAPSGVKDHPPTKTPPRGAVGTTDSPAERPSRRTPAVRVADPPRSRDPVERAARAGREPPVEERSATRAVRRDPLAPGLDPTSSGRSPAGVGSPAGERRTTLPVPGAFGLSRATSGPATAPPGARGAPAPAYAEELPGLMDVEPAPIQPPPGEVSAGEAAQEPRASALALPADPAPLLPSALSGAAGGLAVFIGLEALRRRRGA